MPLHKGGIDAIYCNEKYVVTGGRDGLIKILDNKKYAELLVLDGKVLLENSADTQIRSV